MAAPELKMPTSGGRSINERDRHGEPNVLLSETLHAEFGMDHYRKQMFLMKLPNDKLKQLRAVLTQQIAWVDECLAAKAALSMRDGSYAPLYPELQTSAERVLSLLDSHLLSALRSSKPLAQLSRLLHEETPGVYSFRLFSDEMCAMLLAETDAYMRFLASNPLAHSEIPGFNRRNIVLDDFGLSHMQDTLFAAVVQPLGALLYPSVASGLDYRYGYIIGYQAGGGEAVHTSKLLPTPSSNGTDVLLPVHLSAIADREALVHHTDDSELTLNVSLGKAFEGGELVMRGLRSDTTVAGAGEEVHIKPLPGRAIIHLGQHVHEVTRVTAGERYAYIMWARSDEYRASHCPCCLIHRRDKGCICDGSLN